ncbi:MAG: hypothetical protein LH614_22625 [Pyrinomonadaceae bacterium]|nr:hypothetical protein [Pyrinomonadaceae bacterium]
MLGTLFLVLGLAAMKVAVWQSGLLAGLLGTTQPPDYAVSALSFTAAIIFFGLWRANKNNGKEPRRNFFID